MLQRLNLGVVVAMVTGAIFGVVTTIEGVVGRTIGAINASLLEHAIAGLIAIPAIVFLLMSRRLDMESTRSILPLSAVVAVLVIIAVAGVAYAMPRIGVTTGNMAILFGQLGIVLLVDTLGIGGYPKVALSLPRIAGLLLMGAGILLVLPRST